MSHSSATPASPRFEVADPALAIGSTHHGFTVTSIEPLEELSATGYVLRHDNSGARVLWIACADPNRSFSIAFKTPPADNTGVFHILEHSVLCGSQSYPVKEPFVNLLKTSMQTFLNAMTFPDKTVYPVSSTNVQDFENLMDVYLDAVLHPAIYQKPAIFEQEGWHYELDELESPLTYNGVVFNEMKGALSDPDDVLFQTICRELFPNTAYRFESGGHPRSIPKLTYEEFLDNHRRHYNLANSYTIFYGDLDIERELGRLADHFASATERTGEPNELALQEGIVAPLSQIRMATSPDNASVGLSYIIGNAADRERVLATDILLDALTGSNEAPLKRAILDADIADDLQTAMLDSMLQPQVLLVLKGSHEGVAESFRTLVEDTCRSLVSTGIDRERLEASIAQAEFNLREGDWSVPDGVALSLRALASWLYDDNRPVDYLRYEQAIAHMREGLESGYFERLLDELICSSTHNAIVELVPVEEGDAAEELAELAARKAEMSADELAQVQADVATLREEQERPDAPEDLAKLPRLGLSDIGEAPAERPLEVVDAPLPCLAHELETHRIDYVYHYFDLRRLAYEELPYASILCGLLGCLDTEKHTASELDTLVELKLGSLEFFCETYGRDTDLHYGRPFLVVGASALSENVDALATLPAEVWSSTRFDDLDRIHDILQQRRVALEQQFVTSGHSSAMAQLSTYFSAASEIVGQTGGVDFYRFLKDLLAHWDERAAELPQRLGELSKRIFTSDDVTVSFTGPKADRDAFWEKGGSLGLASDPKAAAHKLELPTPSIKNEGFIIPANVCFVAEGQGPSELDAADRGTWQVAQKVLSLDYLWNEVRVKGGAYGCGFRRSANKLQQHWSYRDPNVDATVQRFEESGEWLKAWDANDDDLAGYIVSVVASHDAPVRPRQLARRQDLLYFTQHGPEWREQLRAEELAATVEKIRALAEPMSKLAEHRALCVFGGKELLEASEAQLELIDLFA